jgi:hypothetical protein
MDEEENLTTTSHLYSRNSWLQTVIMKSLGCMVEPPKPTDELPPLLLSASGYGEAHPTSPMSVPLNVVRDPTCNPRHELDWREANI